MENIKAARSFLNRNYETSTYKYYNSPFAIHNFVRAMQTLLTNKLPYKNVFNDIEPVISLKS